MQFVLHTRTKPRKGLRGGDSSKVSSTGSYDPVFINQCCGPPAIPLQHINEFKAALQRVCSQLTSSLREVRVRQELVIKLQSLHPTSDQLQPIWAQLYFPIQSSKWANLFELLFTGTSLVTWRADRHVHTISSSKPMQNDHSRFLSERFLDF